MVKISTFLNSIISYLIQIFIVVFVRIVTLDILGGGMTPPLNPALVHATVK